MDRREIEINLRALGQKLAQRDLVGEILHPGLNIHTPSPRHIFAMKAEAARAGTSDFEDLRALSMKTKLTLETLFEEDG